MSLSEKDWFVWLLSAINWFKRKGKEDDDDDDHYDDDDDDDHDDDDDDESERRSSVSVFENVGESL